MAASFVELRFLHGALGRSDARARGVERRLRRLGRGLQLHQPVGDSLDPARAFLEGVLRLLHLELFLLLVRLDRGELLANRAAPRLCLLRALRKLQVLDLALVVLLADAGDLAAQAPRLVLGLGDPDVERLRLRLESVAQARFAGQLLLQRLDLALALQHAVQFRLRAVEDDAIAAEAMPGLRHQHAAGGQHAREVQRVLARGQEEEG